MVSVDGLVSGGVALWEGTWADGLDGLLGHLEKRRALEHRIMGEVFGENAVVVRAKGYEMGEIEL